MKQKIHLIIISIFLITTFGWKCFQQKSTELKFNNQSNIFIDSVVFFVNNCKWKMNSIKPNSSRKNMVNLDSLQLNNHDVTVRANLYLKDSLFRGAYNYDDLRGDLAESYILILKPDSTTQLISKRIVY
jgi:hypothetical protein